MTSDYVEQRRGVYLVPGTRVPISLIVAAFTAGQSAESIAGFFRVLTLEQVNGAIDYYMAHRVEIDRRLEDQRQAYAAKREARTADPRVHKELSDAKKQPPGLS